MERATLTVQEAAAYIGVSDDTIYNMVREVQIPHLRVRKRILFRKDAIDQWMAKQDGFEEKAQVIEMPTIRVDKKLIIADISEKLAKLVGV